MSTEFFNDQWRIPSNENQNKISNYSMDLNAASGNFISINNAGDSLLNNATAFTISAWINPTADTGTHQNIFTNWGNATAKQNVMIRFNTQESLQFYVRTTNGQVILSTVNNLIKFNQWQHIVATYDGVNMRIYYNGASTVSPAAQTGNVNTSTEEDQIGKRWTYGQYFNGQIDQVTIFDYALSQDQVTQLGAEGYAFNFNGTTDYITAGTLIPNLYSGDITFSTWVYFRDFSTSEYFLDTGPVSGTYSGVFMGALQTSGNLLVSRSVAGVADSSAGVLVSGVLTTGKWHHIVGVYDTDGYLGTTAQCKVYVDGQLIGTGNGTGSPTTQGYELYIGKIGLNNNRNLNGLMSNVSFFNTPLSSTDVQTLYNNGKPGNISSLNPTAWYKLDDTATFNSSTSVWTIPDASTNSNNGTSFGMNASSLVASNINGELIANPMSLSPKPVAYYQLGDQSVDNGANYLVPNNSLSDYVFNFDGTDDYIDCGNITALNSQSAFSTSAWINYSGTIGPGTSHIVLSGGSSSTNRFWYQLLSSTQIRYGSGPGSSTDITVSNMSSGTWYHIVTVHNGTSLDVYLNGIKQGATVTVVSPSTTIGNNFKIGDYFSLVNYLWNGELSNISVFNTALSIANIETIYNNGAPNDISSLSPVAWYKLNASEIFNNTSTEWSIDNNAYPSVYQSSLNFDSDSVNCGNTLGSGYSSISVSSWVNFDNPNLNVREEIISKDDGSSNRTFFLVKFRNSDWAAYGTIGFAINDGTTTSNATVSQADFTPSAGDWFHVAGTWDGTNIKLYINGDLKKTTAFSASNLDTNTVNVLIGDSSAGGTYFLNGQISNTAVWNTALTSTQVGTLYNNGTPASDISSLSPVSWWKLDNTTTGLIDNGSASNNGTNNGATEYAGFVNGLAGESYSMDSSNLVVSDLQQTSGYSPYALDFSGITAHLKTNTIPAAINTVTLSAWVKRTGNAGQYAGVFGVRNSVGTPSFGLCWQISFGNNDNKIRFRTSADSSSGWQEVVQNDVMPDNTWHHVAGVADGTNLKIYINGVLQTDTKTQTNGTLQSPTSNIFFGMQSTTSSPFNGQLSNCARWNIGLTQAQVTEIYNQGVPSNLNNFSGTAPIGWWQLGSNSSFNTNWTCLDEIGTSNAAGSTNMTNDDIVNGPGYSASGLGSSSIDIVGDAPYSTANGLSENMDVLDRTLDTPIRNTHSIQLDGIDDYINLSTSPSALIGAMNPYSVSAWVYVAQSDLGNGTNYFIIGAQNGIDRWYFRIKDGYARFAYGTLLDNTTLTPITGNQWNHVVFTYNGVDNFNTYINGVNKSTVTNSATQGVPSFNAFIGALNAGSGAINQFKGKIDEVSIFSSKLSGTQVTSIYNNGVPNNILPLNPALWYRFESLTTNAGVVTIADDSGNGLTGTVENGAVLSTIVP